MIFVKKRRRKKNILLLFYAAVVLLTIGSFAYTLKIFSTANIVVIALGIAAFSATGFSLFLESSLIKGQARRIIFSYLFAIAIGTLMDYIFHHVIYCTRSICTADNVFLFSAAITTTLFFFTMSLFSCEHPPSLGIAIGFLLHDWDLKTIVIIISCLILLLLIKRLFHRWLIKWEVPS